MSANDTLRPEDEERLARYRAGVMPAAEREAFERDVLASDALAAALYHEEAWDTAMAGPPRVIDARPALLARRRGWWMTRIALPAAASVAILAGLLHFLQAARAPEADPVRGAGGTVAPIAPLGELAKPPSLFVWSGDLGAASYRVDLFAKGGAWLASVVTADTTIAAFALSAAPLTGGEWRVVPIGADGLERPATPRVAFRVPAP